MKATLLALATTLIASTAAFANDGLFDVNDAPANYDVHQAQALDYEPSASVSFSSYDNTDLNYDPNANDALFD